MKYFKYIFILSAAIGLSGCTGFLTSNKNNNPSGAATIFGKGTGFEEVNVFQLLNPNENYDVNGVKIGDSDDYIYLEYSLMRFYDRIWPLTTEQRKIERNRSQQRIIAASNQRCGAFKQALQKYQGDVSFTLGSITTLLAGAGAIVSHEKTAKSLSALAGISSGVRAEFNSSYFRNITIEVLGKGIDSRRNQIFNEIKQKSNREFIDYTVEEAIGDALNYHAACNVISGLQEASAALTKQEIDPGLLALSQTYSTVRGIGEAQSTEQELMFGRSQTVNPIEYFLKAETVLVQLKDIKSKVDALAPSTGSSEEVEKKALTPTIDALVNRIEGNVLTAAEKQVVKNIKNEWPELIANIKLTEDEGQIKLLMSKLQEQIAAAERRQTQLILDIKEMQGLIEESKNLIKAVNG